MSRSSSPPSDLFYLAPGFPTSSLKVDQLKDILAKHNVSIGSAKLKAELIALFERKVLPKRERIYSKREEETMSICDLGSSRFASDSESESDDEAVRESKKKLAQVFGKIEEPRAKAKGKEREASQNAWIKEEIAGIKDDVARQMEDLEAQFVAQMEAMEKAHHNQFQQLWDTMETLNVLVQSGKEKEKEKEKSARRRSAASEPPHL